MARYRGHIVRKVVHTSSPAKEYIYHIDCMYHIQYMNLPSLLLSGISPAPPFINVRLPAHNRQQSTQRNRRRGLGEVIHFPRLFGLWHSFTKTASFSWLFCMRELMFNLEDAPTSLPFVVVLFHSIQYRTLVPHTETSLG